MKSPIDEKLLFSSNPMIRLEYSKRLAKENQKELKHYIKEIYSGDWPRYWFGSGNAWLVFLGPSPGNSGVDIEKKLPTIGMPHKTLPHLRRL